MRKMSMNELDRLTPEAFMSEPKTSLALVLDDVRSALNTGSAFRTADAFALEKIYLCGITATPPHREILKTALGATETISWTYFPQTVEAIQYLKKEGWVVLAVEQAEGSVALHHFLPKTGEKYALIFGNEVNGVSDKAMALVDGCIEIPQFGTKHSLNIAVSIGIVVWDLFQKMKFQQS